MLSTYSNQLVGPGVLHLSSTTDPHAAWLVDQFEQIRRLFAATAGFLPRVYKDSTDTALQYSVKNGKWINANGALQEFTGGVNLGPLTNAATNYISLSDTGTTTADLTVSTSAFPAVTTRHLRLATITPASSNWHPDTATEMTDWLSLGLVGPVGSASLRSIMVGPLTYADLAASLTDQPLIIAGSSRGIVMPKAGYIIGSSATVDSARTAGTCTIKPAKATTAAGAFSALTPTGLNLLLDGTDTLQDRATVNYGTTNYDFAAGDRLNFLVTTDGTWAPANADLTAILLVIMDA